MRIVDAAVHLPRWLGVVFLAGVAACAARGPAASSAPSRLGDSRQTLPQQIAAARSLSPPLVVSPDSVVSSGGVLNAILVAEPGTYTLGADTFTSNLYNGSYVPPTLVMSPGDSIALTLVNGLDYNGWFPDTAAVTNLHYHGFNVTPLPPGDDVLMHIANEQQFSYAFRMPTWHRPGLYWYHPHPHGISEGQVTDGMSGAMVVRGLIESYFPQFAGIPRS